MNNIRKEDILSLKEHRSVEIFFILPTDEHLDQAAEVLVQVELFSRQTNDGDNWLNGPIRQ